MKGYKIYTYFIKYLSNKNNTSKTCAFKSFLTILSELDAIFYSVFRFMGKECT